jgi:hypothetical protein
MKITSKTLMVSFETEVKLGNNDAIELTLQHQAFILEKKDGGIGIELELGMNVTDVKFLGVEIERVIAFREFKATLSKLGKATLSKLGIDLDKLIDEEEKNIRDSGIEDKLKLMFKDKF